MNCNLMINTAPSVEKTSDPGRAASTAAASKPAEGKSAFHKQLQKVQPKHEDQGQHQKNQTRAAEETVEETGDSAPEQEGDTACAAMLQGVDGLCQTLLAAVEEFQAAVGEETADQNPSPQVESLKTTVSMSDESSEAIVQALATLVQTLEEAVTSSDDAADQPPTTASVAASGTAAVAEADSIVDTETQPELPGKIMLMLHQNKNHLAVKLKIQDDTGMNQAAKDAPQESATGQVKKLMDFESQRLSAVKLSTDTSSNQTTTETGDEGGTQGEQSDAAPNFTLISRETPGVTKLTIRESVAQTPLPKTEEVFDQIVDQAKVMLKANSSEMQIELKPDFLGKMTIKIMVEDGMVTAKFVTDNQQVKQMLESNLANLRQTLENNGLKVDRTEVDVQVGNNWLAGSSTGQQPSESGPGYQSTGYAEDLMDDGLNAAWLEEAAGAAASAYTSLEEGQMSIVI